MIKTSRQLKDLINNLARKNTADAQLLMRNYMMERFLERVTVQGEFYLEGRDAGRGHGWAGYTLHHGH